MRSTALWLVCVDSLSCSLWTFPQKVRFFAFAALPARSQCAVGPLFFVCLGLPTPHPGTDYHGPPSSRSRGILSNARSPPPCGRTVILTADSESTRESTCSPRPEGPSGASRRVSQRSVSVGWARSHLVCGPCWLSRRETEGSLFALSRAALVGCDQVGPACTCLAESVPRGVCREAGRAWWWVRVGHPGR